VYKAPRGTTDILPQEQPYWELVRQKIVAICQLYGYSRIDTPIFEDARLFARSIGEETDIVEKEMYVFQDRGGDRMTLRPEGTAPVCRAYVEHGMHNLPQPVKLYYIGPAFRYERPQAGRRRQHYQFGYEAIGDADPALDAEVIDMAWQLYTSLGLSHLQLLLNSIGCRECRPKYLAKLKEYYRDLAGQLCADCQQRLVRNPLRLLDCKRPSCQRAARHAPRSADHLCAACLEHFQQLQRYLGLLGLPYKLDHRLVRGLDYYTRTVFEIQPRGVSGAQSTLGGGGRYDDLIAELGGKPTPAVGLATGMERIVLNLKKQKLPVPQPPPATIWVAHVGDAAKAEAIGLTAQLRRAGVAALMGMGGRSLKAQLRQANALGVSQAIIIGEEEVARGELTLRDMVAGQQQRVPRSEILSVLKGRHLGTDDI